MKNLIELVDLIKDAFEFDGFYSNELNKRVALIKTVLQNINTEELEKFASDIEPKYFDFYMESYNRQMYKNCIWLFLADIYAKNKIDSKNDIKRYIYAM